MSTLEYSVEFHYLPIKTDERHPKAADEPGSDQIFDKNLPTAHEDMPIQTFYFHDDGNLWKDGILNVFVRHQTENPHTNANGSTNCTQPGRIRVKFHNVESQHEPSCMRKQPDRGAVTVS